MENNIERRSIELIIESINKIGYCYVADPKIIVEKARKYGFELIADCNTVMLKNKPSPENKESQLNLF